MIACVIAAAARPLPPARCRPLLRSSLAPGPNLDEPSAILCPIMPNCFLALIQIKRETAHGQRCKIQFVAGEVKKKGEGEREKKEKGNQR